MVIKQGLQQSNFVWSEISMLIDIGGIGAVPLNQHGHPRYERDVDGVPLCPMKLRMHPTIQFNHTNGYRAQRFQCPLLFPVKKGKGCVKDVNWELGASRV